MAGIWYTMSVVSAANRSTSTVGVGTLRVSQVEVGCVFTVDSADICRVVAVTDDTHPGAGEKHVPGGVLADVSKWLKATAAGIYAWRAITC